MPPADNLVAIEGAPSYGAAHGVLEPLIEVLCDGHVLFLEEEPLVPVRLGLGEFLVYFSARLTVERLALWSHGCWDRVAGHVEPALLVAGYPAFSVTVLLGHRVLLSST